MRRPAIRSCRPVLLAAVLLAAVFVLSVGPASSATAAPAKDDRASAGTTADAEAAAEESVTAFVGGIVLPVSGPPLTRGTVIVRGKKIEAVGVELSIPSGAEVVDTTGRYVLPGLVAVEASNIGIVPGTGGLEARLDPYDLELRLLLASGVTTANVVAGSSFFHGGIFRTSKTASAIIKLSHADLDAMLVREPGLNYFSLPTRQVELNLFNLREGFREAAEYLKARAEAEAKKEKPPKQPQKIARYVTILENERPTLVSASDRRQIHDLLALHDEYPFDLVIADPTEGYSSARELAARDIPVILSARGPDFDFDLTSPVLDEDGLVPVRLAAAFSDAGVRVALAPQQRGVSLMGLAGRDLTALGVEAGFAIRGGLDESRALEGITLQPARVLRIDDRVGSLESGKDADILVLNRHPCDYRSFVLKAYIEGRLYYDRAVSRLYRDIPLK